MSGERKAAVDDGDLTQRDYQRLAAFRFALRRFMHFSTQAAQDAGLTTSQHQALLSIKGHGPDRPMTVGQLAAHLVVAPHTAAELVSRLEEDGMLKKVPDTDDRRRIGLRLTAKADRALRRLTDIHLEEVRTMAPDLIATLQGLLSPDAPRDPVRPGERHGIDEEIVPLQFASSPCMAHQFEDCSVAPARTDDRDDNADSKPSRK